MCRHDRTAHTACGSLRSWYTTKILGTGAGTGQGSRKFRFSICAATQVDVIDACVSSRRTQVDPVQDSEFVGQLWHFCGLEGGWGSEEGVESVIRRRFVDAVNFTLRNVRKAGLIVVRQPAGAAGGGIGVCVWREDVIETWAGDRKAVEAWVNVSRCASAGTRAARRPLVRSLAQVPKPADALAMEFEEKLHF